MVLDSDNKEPKSTAKAWEVILYTCDGIFLIDLIAQFFTTVQDKETMTEITDRKLIAKDYIFGGWFFVDFVSIIPFDAIMGAYAASHSKANGFVRAAKFGKIYKLIKLMRLVKILKLVKNKDKINAHMQKSLKVSSGTERLIFCFIVFSCVHLHMSSLFVPLDIARLASV